MSTLMKNNRQDAKGNFELLLTQSLNILLGVLGASAVRFLFPSDREKKSERASLAWYAVNLYPPAMFTHDMPDKRKPEPDTLDCTAV